MEGERGGVKRETPDWETTQHITHTDIKPPPNPWPTSKALLLETDLSNCRWSAGKGFVLINS